MSNKKELFDNYLSALAVKLSTVKDGRVIKWTKNSIITYIIYEVVAVATTLGWIFGWESMVTDTYFEYKNCTNNYDASVMKEKLKKNVCIMVVVYIAWIIFLVVASKKVLKQLDYVD